MRQTLWIAELHSALWLCGGPKSAKCKSAIRGLASHRARAQNSDPCERINRPMADSDVTAYPQPQHRGWYSRGYLPHLDVVGLIQHISFHLADSLPATALERLHWELQSMPQSEATLARRRRLNELLDEGHGCCLLAQPSCAAVIEESLYHGDGARYRLLCWVVMPNHVHVLVETCPGWPIGKLVQSWKRHTSRQIHVAHASAPRPLWQREYWDRFVRSDNHLATVRDYIEQNPVKAGLVATPAQWPWSSARFGGP